VLDNLSFGAVSDVDCSWFPDEVREAIAKYKHKSIAVKLSKRNPSALLAGMLFILFWGVC
jgi:hypothetical protein